MEYLVEELEVVVPGMELLGSAGKALLTCTIEITSWDYESGFAGVPYNGGENMPEPGYDSSYIVREWSIVCPITLLVVETDKEIRIEKYDGDNAYVKNLKQQMQNKLDWEAIEERLKEYVGG